jgi:hypothetical protein
LHLIDDGLATIMGKALIDFGLPKPPVPQDDLEMETNRLIHDQLEDDIPTLQEQTRHAIPIFNVDQHTAFDGIHAAYRVGEHAVFFIDDYGGIGKTYLENVIFNSIRHNSDIALAVGSSGIAALFLEKGWTTHSRFKIPMQFTPSSECTITRQMDVAKLICRT